MAKALALIALAMAVHACASPEDAARARFRERLRDKTALSHAEINQLIVETLSAIAGRPLRVRDAAAIRTLETRDRADALQVLSGTIPTSDGGLRAIERRVLRGIEGPATPAHAELDASQTLWIDVDTFLPERFELTYSLPGFGDRAYDFAW